MDNGAILEKQNNLRIMEAFQEERTARTRTLIQGQGFVARSDPFERRQGLRICEEMSAVDEILGAENMARN